MIRYRQLLLLVVAMGTIHTANAKLAMVPLSYMVACSDTVIVGRVVSVGPAQADGDREADVQVEEMFKGDREERVRVFTTAPLHEDAPLERGEKAVMFLNTFKSRLVFTQGWGGKLPIAGTSVRIDYIRDLPERAELGNVVDRILDMIASNPTCPIPGRSAR